MNLFLSLGNNEITSFNYLNSTEHGFKDSIEFQNKDNVITHFKASQLSEIHAI